MDSASDISEGVSSSVLQTDVSPPSPADSGTGPAPPKTRAKVPRVSVAGAAGSRAPAIECSSRSDFVGLDMNRGASAAAADASVSALPPTGLLACEPTPQLAQFLPVVGEALSPAPQALSSPQQEQEQQQQEQQEQEQQEQEKQEQQQQVLTEAIAATIMAEIMCPEDASVVRGSREEMEVGNAASQSPPNFGSHDGLRTCSSPSSVVSRADSETSTTCAAAAAVLGGCASTYDSMLQHLRRMDLPPIVGLRFELLLDGAPCLGEKSESQLHVVVVRRVSQLNYCRSLGLIGMLACMLTALCYLFGPITGIIALFVLNNHHLAHAFAIGKSRASGSAAETGVGAGVEGAGAGAEEGDSRQGTQTVRLDCAGDAEQSPDCPGANREIREETACASLHCHPRNGVCTADVASFSCCSVVVVTFLHQFSDRSAFVAQIEMLLGALLIFMAYSCMDEDSSLEQRRFHQSRSVLFMLALQWIVVLCCMHCFTFDPDPFFGLVGFFLKVVTIGPFTLMVFTLHTKFLLCCTEFFSKSGLPHFQDPQLFIFGSDDISRVLSIRFAVRNQSQKVLDSLGIGHMKPEHIDSVCVGHVTTERWASALIFHSLYNSPGWRKILYLTYTYFLPLINILYLLVFPSAALARAIALVRESFGNDVTVRMLTLVRWVLERALGSMLHETVESIGSSVQVVRDNAERVSWYIAACDQWISYLVSRLTPFKLMCGILFAVAQGLGNILFKGIGGIFFSLFKLLNPVFTKILPNINSAGGKVDMAGKVEMQVRDFVKKLNRSGAPHPASTFKGPSAPLEAREESYFAKKNE
jgi:hypothetical protein